MTAAKIKTLCLFILIFIILHVFFCPVVFFALRLPQSGSTQNTVSIPEIG